MVFYTFNPEVRARVVFLFYTERDTIWTLFLLPDGLSSEDDQDRTTTTAHRAHLLLASNSFLSLKLLYHPDPSKGTDGRWCCYTFYHHHLPACLAVPIQLLSFPWLFFTLGVFNSHSFGMHCFMGRTAVVVGWRVLKTGGEGETDGRWLFNCFTAQREDRYYWLTWDVHRPLLGPFIGIKLCFPLFKIETASSN